MIAEQSSVIFYPICMTNVSYERKIIVLSFSVISFVILIFVFQRFEIKSGFSLFLDSHCIFIYIFKSLAFSFSSEEGFIMNYIKYNQIDIT